jgi:hypothetical protein
VQALLAGIFPVLLAGMGVSWMRLWWMSRPVDKFRDPPAGVKLKKIHRRALPSSSLRVNPGWLLRCAVLPQALCLLPPDGGLCACQLAGEW